MDTNIAIQVQKISKTFRLPHEKISSIRGAFVGAFRRNTTFEEFKALDNVSFEVKKGEFFGIIGRNGSGKSTLLKILAGIYFPDKGMVKTAGLISPFLELGIGFNPELSGRDNIYLNATVLGLSKNEIDKKFDSIVAFSELERFIDQKLKNYSSGMQVRLAFSVSIHANRDILLMDEVLAVGDSNFQSKCIEEFVRYKETGRTVVIVTHDIGVVQRYCDRAMLLRSGKVIKVGDVESVVKEYVYENMSDEEKRLVREEQESLDLESKKLLEQTEVSKQGKIAKITRIDFLNSESKSQNVFEPGDTIIFRVYFNKFRDIDINCGISLYNTHNVYISGFHTKIDASFKENNVKDREYFEMQLTDNPLKNGTYYLKVGIIGDSFGTYFDYLDKSREFKIMSNNQNQEGVVYLNQNWQ